MPETGANITDIGVGNLPRSPAAKREGAFQAAYHAHSADSSTATVNEARKMAFKQETSAASRCLPQMGLSTQIWDDDSL